MRFKICLGLALLFILLLPTLSQIPPTFAHWGQDIEYPTDRWKWVWYDFTGNLGDPGGSRIGTGMYTSQHTFSQDWGEGNVGGSGKADNVFVTISGSWNFPESNQYTFKIRSDDGFKLLLDGQVILEDWRYRGYSDGYKETTRYVTSGYHNLLIYYFEGSGSAAIEYNRYLATGGTVKVSFYSIDDQYRGQDPSTKPDLGAKLRATYKYQGQQVTQEFNTPKTIDIDKNSYLTISVVQNPSGWYFAEKWDWWGHSQYSVPSLSINDIGTSDSKVAAFFLRDVRVTVRIWGGDCYPDHGVQADGSTTGDSKWWSPISSTDFYVDGNNIGSIYPGQYKDVQLTKGKHRFRAQTTITGSWRYFFLFWAQGGTDNKIGTDLGNGEVEIDVQSDMSIVPKYSPLVTGRFGTVSGDSFKLNDQSSPFWTDWWSPDIPLWSYIWNYPDGPTDVDVTISISLSGIQGIDSASEFDPGKTDWWSARQFKWPSEKSSAVGEYIKIKIKGTSTSSSASSGSPTSFIATVTFTRSDSKGTFTQIRQPGGYVRARVMEIVFDNGEPIKYTPGQPVVISGYYRQRDGPSSENGKGAPNAPVHLRPDWTGDQIVYTDGNGHFSATFTTTTGDHTLRAIAWSSTQSYQYAWKYEIVDRSGIPVKPGGDIPPQPVTINAIGHNPSSDRGSSSSLTNNVNGGTMYASWDGGSTSCSFGSSMSVPKNKEITFSVSGGSPGTFSNKWDAWGVGQKDGSTVKYTFTGDGPYYVIAFYDGSGGGPQKRIDVYAIDNQYRGQDPATKQDLGASIRITYTSNGQSKSETYTTHFYVMADQNTQVTLQVITSPSGWSFNNYWDDYGQAGQKNVATVTYDVGTTDHKIAAFFIKSTTDKATIKAIAHSPSSDRGTGNSLTNNIVSGTMYASWSGGSTSVGFNGEMQVPVNTPITFSVTYPGSDYTFANKWDAWSIGWADGSTATYTFSSTSTYNVIAFFDPTASPFDFSISASPSNPSIKPGETGTSTITVTLSSGSTQTVTLSWTAIDTLPSGTTVQLSPASGNPTFTSTLSITLPSTATPGNTYRIKVTGTGGGKTHDVMVTVTVAKPDSVTIKLHAHTDAYQFPTEQPGGDLNITISVKYVSNGILKEEKMNPAGKSYVAITADKGSTIEVSVPSSDPIFGLTRLVWKEWDVYGLGRNQARTYSFTTTIDRDVIAYYTRQHFLTVESDPGGLVDFSSVQGWKNEGTSVQLSAPDPVTYEGTQYSFTTWKVDGTEKSGNPITVTMDAPHRATAVYERPSNKYVLSVSSSPELSINVTVSGQGHYQDKKATPCRFLLDPGTYTVSVPLTVNSNGVTYTFNYWLGDAGGSDNQISIQMDRDKGITAVYAAPEDTLTIQLKDEGGAEIPCAGARFEVQYGQRSITVDTDNRGIATVSNIPAGSPVIVKDLSLTVYPAGGVQQSFKDWSGVSGTKNGNVFSFTFVSACTLEAIYGTQYSLTIQTRGLSASNPTKVYLDGKEVGTAYDGAPLVLWFDKGSQTGTIGVDDEVNGIKFIAWEDGPTDNPRPSIVMGSPVVYVASYSTFNFALTVYPSVVVVPVGGTASYTISAELLIGSPKSISLSVSVSGLPSGVTPSLDPNNGLLPLISSLVVTTSDATPTGTYTITIEGIAEGGEARQATATLIVTNTPDFNVLLDKHTIPFTTDGGTSTATVSVRSVNGFNDQVGLSYEWINSPSGISVSINQSSVTPPVDGEAASEITITVDAGATPGTYFLKVKGTSGSLERYDTLRVIVSTEELHILHVKSSPISGVVIRISGDFTGSGATPFDIGPSKHPFSVGLAAPATVWHGNMTHNFLRWYVDTEIYDANQVTVNVGSEHIAWVEYTDVEIVIVEIIQPENGATVSGLMYVKAHITSNKMGPGAISNASMKLENATWSSGWIGMQRLDAEGNWHASYDTLGLANGAYKLTVNGTSMARGTPTYGEASITVNIDNTGVEHKKTFYLNVFENKLYEEDRFLPGETMVAKFRLDPKFAGQQVIIALSGGDSLIYPGRLSQYPSSQTKVIPPNGIVEATFPFDFKKPGIYGDYQVRVLNATNPTQQLDFANFHIMDGGANWVVVHGLGSAKVVVNLYWAGTSDPIVGRTGTIQASASFPPTNDMLTGVIDSNGGIAINVPYYEWKGELEFKITFAASSIEVLQDSKHSIQYDSLAMSFGITSQDYKATVTMNFYIKGTSTPVDAWAYVQASPVQQWVSGKTSGGRIIHELSITQKPRSMLLLSWCYAMVSDRILANQYSNIQLSKDEVKLTPTIESAKIEQGYLNLHVSITSGTMWMDMNNVEAVVQAYSMQGKLIKTQTFAFPIKHGEVNHEVLQLTGIGAGTYKMVVTLYYAGQVVGQTEETVAAA